MKNMDLSTKRKICLGGIGPNVIFLIFNVIDTDIHTALENYLSIQAPWIIQYGIEMSFLFFERKIKIPFILLCNLYT